MSKDQAWNEATDRVILCLVRSGVDLASAGETEISNLAAEIMVAAERPTRTVTINIQDRDDGGVFVTSDDLPGLILSGADRAGIFSCIGPSIMALIDHEGKRKPSDG